MAEKRKDDFNIRRAHLAELSDEELKARFFTLAEEIVEPLIALSKKSTSPSVERSVLLRMGFSSLEARDIVNHVLDLGLMGKGAGNIVLKTAEKLKKDYLEVGREMAEGKHLDLAQNIFKGGK
ncbi:ornithine aminomutase subunit alpha [Proteiniclasticum sp. SCR006]|uniref:Ornithine aminomutase subunit alpha n=1 Tax=Proteiniclasticum aestuarii TaxID=2817862 RepID=A0A939H8I7_9CLOT|nr:ornithine aminomutase subunit alpha [Proteiniclasticum aestuarii]MBO1264469.1 ornithine aminomutase subunit alpha [Proteiniclasticum aestuarii]